MSDWVCVKCSGNVGCTLSFPEEERDCKPAICGPDKQGLLRTAEWYKVPK